MNCQSSFREHRVIEGIDLSSLTSVLYRYGVISYVADVMTVDVARYTVTYLCTLVDPPYAFTGEYMSSPFVFPWSRVLTDLAAVVLLTQLAIEQEFEEV